MSYVPYPDAHTLFSEQLAANNGLRASGFEAWAFYPGMVFGAPVKWWGDRGLRSRPHEGIDLGLYIDKEGKVHRLGPSSRIPLMFDGTIIKVQKDFLGASVFVGHSLGDGRGRQLCTVYGHTNPAEDVRAGNRFGQGEILGTLTEVESGPTGVFTHLHLTVAWVSAGFAPNALNWETLNDPDVAILLDPLQVMNCRHTTLKPDDEPE